MISAWIYLHPLFISQGWAHTLFIFVPSEPGPGLSGMLVRRRDVGCLERWLRQAHPGANRANGEEQQLSQPGQDGGGWTPGLGKGMAGFLSERAQVEKGLGALGGGDTQPTTGRLEGSRVKVLSEKGRREGQGKLRREVSKASGELMNPVLS